MDLIKRIYNSGKRYSIFILVIILASFLFGGFVFAADWDTHVLDAFSTIVYGIVALFGNLIGVMLGVFLELAQYNDFAGSNIKEGHPVAIGWSIIRDLCNMFFVVILLIISIGSILQMETYNYRKWLPKLVVMAVLINFSMMFSGIIIDVSQIIMLTLVSGIVKLGEGNIFDVLGINHFLSMDYSQLQDEVNGSNIIEDKKTGGEVNSMNLFITIILALVTSFIALVVVAAMTIIVGIRIVALWFLVITSPIAYLFSASPVGTKYASEWWQKFSQWLTVGPVMVFFVWLSLISFHATFGDMMVKAGKSASVGLSVIGSTGAMVAFLMASIMLMASLIAAQSAGGLAAKVAGGAYGKITKTGTWAANKFSGKNYVMDRMKAYQGVNQAKKQERITRDASIMHGVTGAVKQATIGKLGEGLSGAVRKTLGSRGKEAEKYDDKAKESRSDAELSKEDLENKYGREQFERGNRQVRELRKKQEGADPAMREVIEAKIEKIEDKQLEGFDADEERSRLNKEADKFEARAEIERLKGGAGKVVSAVPLALFNKMRDAGRDSLDYAQNYKHKEIMKYASEMDDEEKEDLIEKAEDQTIPDYERAGAHMALLKGGHYDDGDEMVEAREYLKKIGDKKTVSVANNYIGRKRPDLVEKGDDVTDKKLEKLIKTGMSPRDFDSEFFSDRGGSNAAVFAQHATKSQHEMLGKSQKEEFRKGIKDIIDNISSANIDGVENVFNEEFRKAMEAYVRHKGDAGEAYQFDGGIFKDKLDSSGKIVAGKDVARKSLLKTMNGGNGVDVIGGIKASEIRGDVSSTIINGYDGEEGLTAAQLRTMAQNAAKSNDSNRIKTVEKIISETKKRGSGKLHDSLAKERQGVLSDFGAGWNVSSEGIMTEGDSDAGGSGGGDSDVGGSDSGAGRSLEDDFDDYSPETPTPSPRIRRRIAEDRFSDYHPGVPRPRIPKVDYITDDKAEKYEEESLKKRKTDNYTPELP